MQGPQQRAARAARAAELLEALGLDEPSKAAARLSCEFDGSAGAMEAVRKQWGPEVAAILASLHRLSQLGGQVSRGPEDTPAQIETLRRMLLALADDIRVVVIALALHIARLEEIAQAMKTADPQWRAEGLRLGEETLRVHAPLANRLGIWQLKWAMEDLAFRMTEPQAYHVIAKQLDQTRQEREAFVTTTVTRLETLMHEAGISGEVAGRPKHLFSIHNKMRSKGLAFDQLMDIRAFRILVDTEAQCYSVLGILHDHWTPMDSEFDDYITRPKANGYQSLHTVLGDERQRPFEVQIRSRDMHQRAELGIAAHWRYKESAAGQTSSDDYESRIAWLRQMLDWGLGSSAPVRLTHDRIYALTPKARIIELPSGATPLDFAYHLHTEIGHRCRGAKVNGQMVSLTTEVKTGQTVELMTVKQGGPSRDWMNPEAGYLKSSRARQKVRTWFHALDLAHDRGAEALNSEVERLQRSEISAEEFILSKIVKPRSTAKGRVLVVGVDRIMTALARCCKPAPPDTIKGFVTRGRGVSVHRESCPTLARMMAGSPERVIETKWGATDEPSDGASDGGYLVDATIVAKSESTLNRDIAEVLAREKIPLAKIDSFPKGELLTLALTLQVRDGAQLKRALAMLQEIRGVISAQRSTLSG